MIAKLEAEIPKDFERVEELGFADIYLQRTHKILLVKYLQNQEIDERKGQIIIDSVHPYLIADYYLGMTDASAPDLNITKKTRELYSNNKSMRLTKAHAVVVKHLNVRIIVNVFIKLNKPISPVKLFNSYESAIAWLLKYSE